MSLNMRWSLEKLYKSFDAPEFLADIEKLDEEIKEFTSWAEKELNDYENVKEKLEAYVKKSNDTGHLVARLMSFVHLTLATDTRNETALKYGEQLEKKMIGFTLPSVKFSRWLKGIEDLDKICEKSSLLKEHSFVLKEAKKEADYLLSEKEEQLIAELKTTGSSAWTKLQGLLTSTLTIELDGKKLPLPVVRNMAYSADKEVRKKAYEAELAAYPKIEDSSAAALNALKGEALTIAKKRGYKSLLEKTLIQSRMDEEILNAMLTAMENNLDNFRKYYKKKGEVLGYENGLPFFELFAPMGDSNMHFTYDEAKDFIVKNFSTFSEKLGKFAENAFENRWIDAEPREGKRGGAFCSNLHVIKESRILANFTGEFGNVKTLAHELGHGYHGFVLSNATFLNSHYPMPLAETASIFCETIVLNAALKEATEKEKITLLEKSISDAGQVIVDIYSRFLFESELIKRRERSALSVNELKEIMLDAQKKAYGYGLDEKYLHPYMWLNKPHYYYADLSFYNFPYAFGLLFAKGLYAEYLKKGEEFVAKYDDILMATGRNRIADVTKMIGIDITKPEFWENSLALIGKEIDELLELL